MCKSQFRNKRNMKGNVTPLQVHNSSMSESKDTEKSGTSYKKFTSHILKMIIDPKENVNKQMSEIKK
jgi:hypothetical protein